MTDSGPLFNPKSSNLSFYFYNPQSSMVKNMVALLCDDDVTQSFMMFYSFDDIFHLNLFFQSSAALHLLIYSTWTYWHWLTASIHRLKILMHLFPGCCHFESIKSKIVRKDFFFKHVYDPHINRIDFILTFQFKLKFWSLFQWWTHKMTSTISISF